MEIWVAYYGDGAVLTAAETLTDLRSALRAIKLNSGALPPLAVAKWTGVPERDRDRILDYADGNRGARTGESVRDGYAAASILRKGGGTGHFRGGGAWATPDEAETTLHGTGVGT